MTMPLDCACGGAAYLPKSNASFHATRNSSGTLIVVSHASASHTGAGRMIYYLGIR
jgi:hypothetical protein